MGSGLDRVAENTTDDISAAGLLGGISPPHIPGLLPAVMQRLPADLPLPQVPSARHKNFIGSLCTRAISDMSRSPLSCHPSQINIIVCAIFRMC